MVQNDILIRSLEKVAGDAEGAEGDGGGWKIKLIMFVEAQVDLCTSMTT